MLSLTNPFRSTQRPATQPTSAAVPLAPPLVPLNTKTTSQPRAPWQTDQKLSSMLSACEAGTHAFSRDDYADARRMSSGKLAPLLH